MPTILHLLENRFFHVALIIVAGLVVYGHTLDAPFYLDDFSSIKENRVIYENSLFGNWQQALTELWQYANIRTIGYLTIALNFELNQFQVQGYHIVNITIHLLTGLAILALLHGVVRTPRLERRLSPQAKIWLPLLVALFFILHPLQIQAVTYIIQRLASLAALFYIASMACFIYLRLARQRVTLLLAGMGCVLFTLLAFLTKQNTATLPLALLLLELTLFPFRWRKTTLIAVLSGLGIAVLWISIALIFGKNPFTLETFAALTRETTLYSRESYFATQMSVLWLYLKLLFYPVGLHIDYYYPATPSLFATQPLLALVGHLVLLGIAIASVRRFPLVALGIGFYYLAHAVESSVLPIKDLIFEHRTYLPNLGIFIVVAWILASVLPRWGNKTVAVLVSVCLLLTLGTMTWLRNDVWRNPIELWKSNVAAAPEKTRGWIILGKHLIQAQRPLEGLEALQKAMNKQKHPDGSYTLTYDVETLINMVVALRMLKRYEEALQLVEQSLRNDMRPFDRAKFLVNKGNVLYTLQRYAETEQAYREAIKVYPHNLAAQTNLATILAATGRYAEAEERYRAILQIDPHNQTIQENLLQIQQLREQQKSGK